jgi:hypothetical protein
MPGKSTRAPARAILRRAITATSRRGSDEADATLAHPHIPETQSEAFVDGFFRGLAGDWSGGQA